MSDSDTMTDNASADIRLPADIAETVRRALAEDIGPGDLTAQLLAEDSVSAARVTCRERAILCGCAWFTETFRQLDEAIQITWHSADGEQLEPGQAVCRLSGATRAILSGERVALNLLQLLSATATITRDHAALLKPGTRLLDTRKTLPGLRAAQKYAVRVGGGENHRMGLYDAILIKENHIRAQGSVGAAVKLAKTTRRQVIVEVENETELEAALQAGADVALLDNFTLEQVRRAVRVNRRRACLEVSGNIRKRDLAALADTGVDRVSIGALTKNVQAIDFTLLLDDD